MSATPRDVLLHNDKTSLCKAIEHLPVTSAQKALGIFSRPDGCMVHHEIYLHQKAETWATAVQAQHFWKDDIWYGLNSTGMKSVEYPLVTTTFSQKDCAHIMAPILPSCLSSLKVQRNLPQTLVYAPLAYLGLGIHDPWLSQLIAHIQVILHHAACPTTTGSLLHSNMENLT